MLGAGDPSLPREERTRGRTEEEEEEGEEEMQKNQFEEIKPLPLLFSGFCFMTEVLERLSVATGRFRQHIHNILIRQSQT